MADPAVAVIRAATAIVFKKVMFVSADEKSQPFLMSPGFSVIPELISLLRI
jgi:hypothetical protein